MPNSWAIWSSATFSACNVAFLSVKEFTVTTYKVRNEYRDKFIYLPVFPEGIVVQEYRAGPWCRSYLERHILRLKETSGLKSNEYFFAYIYGLETAKKSI